MLNIELEVHTVKVKEHGLPPQLQAAKLTRNYPIQYETSSKKKWASVFYQSSSRIAECLNAALSSGQCAGCELTE